MKKKIQRKISESVTHHPLWKEIEPFVEFQIYKREGGGSKNPRFRIGLTRAIPEEVAQRALLCQVKCSNCGAKINPFRIRNTRTQTLAGNIYFAATCPLQIRMGCSRSASATLEYKRLYGLRRTK